MFRSAQPELPTRYLHHIQVLYFAGMDKAMQRPFGERDIETACLLPG